MSLLVALPAHLLEYLGFWLTMESLFRLRRCNKLLASLTFSVYKVDDSVLKKYYLGFIMVMKQKFFLQTIKNAKVLDIMVNTVSSYWFISCTIPTSVSLRSNCDDFCKPLNVIHYINYLEIR